MDISCKNLCVVIFIKSLVVSSSYISWGLLGVYMITTPDHMPDLTIKKPNPKSQIDGNLPTCLPLPGVVFIYIDKLDVLAY